ncbi:MAG: ABC transporter ATP-binding protein/permease [Clostridiales bacterium]|nr:ABC transporter ATP-binding protein/permease [Clostridiales bacterium]
MLELKDIKKEYHVAGGVVHALKGVSIKFRRNEFVSILGASGCGKTTLLNIIGGLDKYTSGDLVIEGRSTKEYKDGDWDTYRNHSVGFIFQSYHLIPHQTILQNVELALTISGVTKEERRRRAIDALERVGLSDKLKNKPNQLSGGQAQRVAIARALINDPEIVLADEPTGALDSKTSVQIMELLEEIAKDRLVIMVTHNPELAEKYSTRIIRLLDGEVTDDTKPFDGIEEPAKKTDDAEAAPAENKAPVVKNKGRKKKSSMSVGMAFGLSLKNLLSKGRRTAMVSVAGSIGIIGVSMVLAISAGVHGFINDMENDMLSGNPVAITQSTYDFTSLMSISQNNTRLDLNKLKKGDKVYVRSLLDTLGTFAQGFERTNNISEAYVDYISKIPEESVNVVQFDYAFNVTNNIYTDFTVSKDVNSRKFPLKEGVTNDFNGGEMSVAAIRSMYSNILSHVEEYKQWGSMISTVRTFAEVPDNFDYVMSQYDVLAVDYNGKSVTSGYSDEYLEDLFNAKETLIMVVENHQFNDLMFAEYGFFTEDEFLDYAFAGVGDDKGAKDKLVGKNGIPYADIVGDGTQNFKFTYYPNDSVYSKQNFKPKYLSDEEVGELITSLLKMSGNDAPEYAQGLTLMILQARKQGDEALKTLLNSLGMGMMFSTLRKPQEDETKEGFIANAYADRAYVIDDGGNERIELPAFKDTSAYEKRVEMGVKMILQKKESVSYGCLDTGLYYTNALTNYILDTEAESEIVKYINATEGGTLDEVPSYVDYYYVDETDNGDFYVLETKQGSIDTGASMMATIIGNVTGGASTEITAAMVGGSRLPTAIYMYPVDFNSKDAVTNYLDAWNRMCEAEKSYTYTGFDGNEATVKLEVKDKITYTDTVGLIIAMINTMIEMITFALIAFTALSLVVSTVMIGIITYVSVVERVKEIGILRAVGARKKDIKRLFNAETFIIGLAAGAVGIGVTYLLSLILNLIIGSLAGIYTIAALPFWQALIMIGVSVVLTLISGLIPASAAAQKDPVVALRTE